MTPILECNGITKKYEKSTALNQLSLQIEPGRIVGLLGPNGSGKTTFIKIAAGILTPNSGSIRISGTPVGYETKSRVSYLPDKNYLNNWMSVESLIDYFNDFYSDFDKNKAFEMLGRLNIQPKQKLKAMSKGTLEKVQLILVMSRNADVYLLDEPIGGVDPAARDYILNTIITNYNENGSIIISTHLIADIERILDDVIFIKGGNIVLSSSVDEIREQNGKSVDELFREVFKC